MPKYRFSVLPVPRYLPERSAPEHDEHVWSYTITIRNSGDVAAQLISRHWVIVDAEGRTQEVRGLGVVGHQPLLQPGQSFEYSSGTSLRTPFGTMRGTYFCTAEDGTQFEVAIPEFALTVPSKLH